MATIIDFDNNIIKYKGKYIMVVFDNKFMPWFNGTHIANVINKNITDVMKSISEVNKKRIDKIVVDYEKFNVEPQTMLIHEEGIDHILRCGHSNLTLEFLIWMKSVIEHTEKYGLIHIIESNKIVYKLQVKYITQLEWCMKDALCRFKYEKQYKCSLYEIIESIEKCANEVNEIMGENKICVIDKSSCNKDDKIYELNFVSYVREVMDIENI